MTEELKALPPPEKKVAAKILYQMGWGSRKIEEWLGVSDSSVVRYKDEQTPEDLKQFEAEFEAAIRDMKQQGVAMAQKRLLELIPKERRIDQVVKAAEYLEGKTNNQLTQINIGSELGVKFEKDAV